MIGRHAARGNPKGSRRLTLDFLYDRHGPAVVGVILAAAFFLAFFVADLRTRPLLLNTLMFAGGSSLISLPVGTFFALLIHRTRLPGRNVFFGLITLMVFVPPYLQVAGWESAFGLQGWFCRYWFPDRAIALLSGWRGAIWIQTLVNVPWIVLILSAGFAGISSELEEQASLYGSPLRVLRHVTLPLLSPAIVASGLAVFVLAANEVTITDVYQIRTFAEEIYTGFALGDSLDEVPIRTLPGMLLVGGLAFASLLVCSQITRNLTIGHRSRHWRADVKKWRVPIWLLLAGVLLLVIVVPMASLVHQAGMQVTMQEGIRMRHWSAAKAIGMVASSPIRFSQEYAWSFALAQLTSITVIVVASILAWASSGSLFVRGMSWGIVLAGLSLPGPFLALLFGRLLNQPNSDWLFYLYDRTLFLPWLTLSVRLFPFAYLVLELVVRRLPKGPMDVARTEGAKRIQLFQLAAWPHVAPAVGGLWLALMALSVADLSSTILAVPPGVTTVAIRIFNLVHYGVADQLAGLCLGTLMLFGSLALLVIRFSRWGGEDRSRS